MASSFIIRCPKLTGGALFPMIIPIPSSLTSPRRGREVFMQGSTRKKTKIFNKRKDDDDDDEQQNYRGNYNLVDENMIVLRMRIKEMKMLGMSGGGGEGEEEEEENMPSNWSGWEKKYFVHYNEDVCEAIGLLQSFLMNTRPSLAVGLVALIATSVPVSTSFVIFNVIEMVKKFF